jgi:3-dehydroquinate synthase
MTVMDVVQVAMGARSYEVRIGAGLIDAAGSQIAPLLRRHRVAIVTDARVAPLHLERFRAALDAEGIASEALILPPGEGPRGGSSLPARSSGFFRHRLSGATWWWRWVAE